VNDIEYTTREKGVKGKRKSSSHVCLSPAISRVSTSSLKQHQQVTYSGILRWNASRSSLCPALLEVATSDRVAFQPEANGGHEMRDLPHTKYAIDNICLSTRDYRDIQEALSRRRFPSRLRRSRKYKRSSNDAQLLDGWSAIRKRPRRGTRPRRS
jgi:hypothetical protein